MSNTRFVLFCFVLLFTCCLRANDVTAPLTFKGFTFEEWKRLLPTDLDRDTRADAYRAMSAFSRHFPEDYLEPATEIIKTNLAKERSAEVSEVGYRLLSKMKMSASERNAMRIAGLRSEQRAAVLKSFPSYPLMPAEEATEALGDAILKILKQDEKKYRDVHHEAVDALGSLIQANEYQMDRSDPMNVKLKRIRPEGESGPILKKVVPMLDRLVNDSPQNVRTQALYMIRTFPPEFAVEQFAEQLRNLVARETIVANERRGRVTEGEWVARFILDNLPNYGPSSKKALPVLRNIQEDYPELQPILGSRLRKAIKAIEKPAE